MKTLRRMLVLVVFLLSSTSLLLAQWVQTNGPIGGYVSSFVVSGTDLFAGTDGGGVFVSTNNGENWRAINSGLANSYVFTLAAVLAPIGGPISFFLD